MEEIGKEKMEREEGKKEEQERKEAGRERGDCRERRIREFQERGGKGKVRIEEEREPGTERRGLFPLYPLYALLHTIFIGFCCESKIWDSPPLCH